MELRLMIPISFGFGLIAFYLIGRWYVQPALARASRASGLTPLLLLHSFRYIGLAFLIPGVVDPQMSPLFSVPAAYGDLGVAVLALVALWAVRRQTAIALPLVWIFNIIGTLDLLYAVSQGLQHVQVGQFGAAYYIPTVAVPALLVSHYLLFQLLLRPERT